MACLESGGQVFPLLEAEFELRIGIDDLFGLLKVLPGFSWIIFFCKLIANYK